MIRYQNNCYSGLYIYIYISLKTFFFGYKQALKCQRFVLVPVFLVWAFQCDNVMHATDYEFLNKPIQLVSLVVAYDYTTLFTNLWRRNVS